MSRKQFINSLSALQLPALLHNNEEHRVEVSGVPLDYVYEKLVLYKYREHLMGVYHPLADVAWSCWRDSNLRPTA